MVSPVKLVVPKSSKLRSGAFSRQVVLEVFYELLLLEEVQRVAWLSGVSVQDLYADSFYFSHWIFNPGHADKH